MKTAGELKSKGYRQSLSAQRIAIYKAKDLLDKAIEEALSNNQTTADVMLPEGMNYNTVKGLIVTLSKLGYTTDHEQTTGYIGNNLVRMPRHILTIGWK